jgi:hypothetical protein
MKHWASLAFSPFNQERNTATMRVKIAGALGGALLLAALTAGSANASSWGEMPENRDWSVNGGPYATHSVTLNNPTPIG